MAMIREFDHCHYCRNGCLAFMCKGCDEFKNYVPRVSDVQFKVIKVLLDPTGALLKDTDNFNNIGLVNTGGLTIQLDQYPISRIRKDTLQGLIDRKIVLLVGHREGLTFPTTTYNLNEKIKWNLR